MARQGSQVEKRGLAIRISSRDIEMREQLGMLPSPDDVDVVLSQVDERYLREFATAIMTVAVDAAWRNCMGLDDARLLNGWFATMEEIVAAGDDLEEILARRIEVWTQDDTK